MKRPSETCLNQVSDGLCFSFVASSHGLLYNSGFTLTGVAIRRNAETVVNIIGLCGRGSGIFSALSEDRQDVALSIPLRAVCTALLFARFSVEYLKSWKLFSPRRWALPLPKSAIKRNCSRSFWQHVLPTKNAIVAGIFIATLLNHLVSAALGVWLASAISPEVMKWVVGGSFIAVGLWLLLPDKDEAPDGKWLKYGAFTATVVLFFLAEIGDKTQMRQFFWRQNTNLSCWS